MDGQTQQENNGNLVTASLESSPLIGLIKLILVYLIGYFKFTQITPAVILYGAMIALFFVVGQTINAPLYIFILLLGRDPTKTTHFGTQDFISIYLVISFILFIFSTLLAKLTGSKFKIRFKRKILILVVSPIITYGLFFVWILFFSKTPVSGDLGQWIFICIFFSSITIAAGIYAISVSYVLNFIVTILKKDEESVVSSGIYRLLTKLYGQ